MDKMTKEQRILHLQKIIDTLSKKEEIAKSAPFENTENKDNESQCPGHDSSERICSRTQSKNTPFQNCYDHPTKIFNKGIKRKNSESTNSPKALKLSKKDHENEDEKNVLKTMDNFFSVVKNIKRFKEREDKDTCIVRKTRNSLNKENISVRNSEKLKNEVEKTKPVEFKQLNVLAQDPVNLGSFKSLGVSNKDTKVTETKKLVTDCALANKEIDGKYFNKPKDDVIKKFYSTQNYGDSFNVNKKINSMPTTTTEVKRAQRKLTFKVYFNAALEKMEKEKRKATQEKETEDENMYLEDKKSKNEIIGQREVGESSTYAMENRTNVFINTNSTNDTFSSILDDMRKNKLLKNKDKKLNTIKQTNVGMVDQKNDTNIIDSFLARHSLDKEATFTSTKTLETVKASVVSSGNSGITLEETADNKSNLDVNVYENVPYNFSQSVPPTNFHNEFNEPSHDVLKTNSTNNTRETSSEIPKIHEIATSARTVQFFFLKNLLSMRNKQVEECRTDLSLAGERYRTSNNEQSNRKEFKTDSSLSSQRLEAFENDQSNSTTQIKQKLTVDQKVSFQDTEHREASAKIRPSFQNFFRKGFKTDSSLADPILDTSKTDQSNLTTQITQKLMVDQKTASQDTENREAGIIRPFFQNLFLKGCRNDVSNSIMQINQVDQNIVTGNKVLVKNIRTPLQKLLLKELLPPMKNTKLEPAIYSSEKFNKEISSQNFTISQALGTSQSSGMCLTQGLSQSPTNRLLQDEMLYSILSKNYEKCQKLKNHVEINRNTNEKFSPKKCIKRYKKGDMKIYRLEKLKRKSKNSDVQDDSAEVFTCADVFKELTQGPSPNRNVKKHQSLSSVSTNSSYITDETKSEVLSTGSKLRSPKRRLRKGINEISKDKSLLYTKIMEFLDPPEISKNVIIEKIQNIFLDVFEDLRNGKNALLRFRKQTIHNCVLQNERLQYKHEASLQTINSSHKKSQSKFKLIIYVMQKILDLLEADTKMTKRELYYQLKHLVNNQTVIDTTVNTISCLLDVGLWKLNIIAQKGLVFGNVKILLASGETINCNVPGTLIPQDISKIIEIHSSSYFILVVEKESIFQKLIEDDLPNKLTRPFILITGKGFPDLNTQLFLKKLWMIMSIPVFILVDADPYGIQIMMNYKFGSLKNAHVSQHLAVPKAKWLGVYPSDIVRFSLPTHNLTKRDLKMMERLLETPLMEEYPKIRNQLNILIKNNYKADIESLLKSDIFLSDVYLPCKLYNHNFI